MVDISTFSIMFAATSVVAGVVYYALQLRHMVKAREDMVKTRQMDILMRLHLTWVDIDRIGWFFNGVGFLVHGKFVDIRLVDDLIGYGVIFLWEKMKPLVEGWRKQLNLPKSFQWFEYLANEMKKREQQQAKIR